MFDAMRHIKPRLWAHGGVANPRDSYGYRCGLRLALRPNASLLFVPPSIDHHTSSLSDLEIVGCKSAAAVHF
ncbi:MAG: hypothetical protein WA129_08825, partial [Acidovorax sp.]